MTDYYSQLVPQLVRRSSEATLSLLGITQPELRHYLSKRFNDEPGSEDSFLADPLFEAVFGWQPADKTTKQLSGHLLEEKLINVLGIPRPYEHQLKSWQALLADQPKSVVVTSGTGSGKTECFMVPILNDLAREVRETGHTLTGVRALFLYPLNALINSQRDRLREWTEAFEGKIRFCLYNGNTKERERPHTQQQTPNEVLSRRMLRESPSPILVTNATMLEYMLVRSIDKPILEKSQGQLRWIVLDEAHTYMGSQAAELSLLLRRVMHSFDVTPADVRFVATSATIGGNEEAEQKLRRFLSSLSGVKEEHILVFGGKRNIPALTDFSPKPATLRQLADLPDLERYHALSDHPTARNLRSILSQSGAMALSQISAQLFEGCDTDNARRQAETLKWLDLCSGTILPSLKNVREEVPFLPLRAHLFHQVSGGLWSCADPKCTAKAKTELANGEWPFGKVYTQQRKHCECGTPVYELVFCQECNTPHLKAKRQLTDTEQRLVQVDQNDVDEFSLQREGSEDDEGTEGSGSHQAAQISSDVQYLSPISDGEKIITYPFNRESSCIGEGDFEIHLCDQTAPSCSHCNFEGYGQGQPFRHTRLGTPFYIGNIVPTLLEYCQDDQKEPLSLPHRGRRLITFTDSRQGTARIAAKLQQDAERMRMRGLVFAKVRQEQRGADVSSLVEQLEKLKNSEQLVAGMPSALEAIRGAIADKEKEILQVQGAGPVTWSELVTRLASEGDLKSHILNYYREQDTVLFNSEGRERTLVELGLIREFVRRPKRQNSLETLGLVSVQYPGLSEVSELPTCWSSFNLLPADWHDFLKVCLDFYVRDGVFFDVPNDWIRWFGSPISSKQLLSPTSEEKADKKNIKWPQIHKGRQHKLVRILCYSLNITTTNPMHQDQINSILRQAWKVLLKARILKNISGTRFQLNKDQIAFSIPKEAWVCPITNRLIDSTFKGITPYLPQSATSKTALCEKVQMPQYPDQHDYASEREKLLSLRTWQQADEHVRALRLRSVWSDICDRVVEEGVFFRSVEHSAQQSAQKLQHYEKLFKEGKLNVLNCSTTMEMGVDIGGISVVANNNVPPHPANYLQRAGRAGRRGETRALALTVCKQNPHEMEVFRNPDWPFTTAIPAPYITLESSRIVQRHVNAMILGHFLKSVIEVQEEETTRLSCAWFFYREDGSRTPIETMADFLDATEPDTMERLSKGLKSLVRGSVLEGWSVIALKEACLEQLSAAKVKWLGRFLRMKKELAGVPEDGARDPYLKRLQFDLDRQGKEYLLSEFASGGFLPGYGFPTGIAQFDPYTVNDFVREQRQKDQREDNLYRRTDKPGRDLSVAIREYAPGTQIVLDGLVYRSSGIALNWHVPVAAGAEVKEAQKLETAWRCSRCGSIDYAGTGENSSCCSDCGASISPDEQVEFLQPSGFAVDFYSSPSNDITTQHYIKPQDPWISARGEVRALPNPELGCYKVDTEGTIFHHSAGENGHGYAVCLECGRAESMTQTGGFPKSPPLSPDLPHKKLRGKRSSGKKGDNAWCEGPERNLIKPNLHLGYKEHTDVFELYLKRPNENAYLFDNWDNRRLVQTLGVALRQGLADCLGINADELGVSFKPVRLDEHPVLALVIFDNCGGGAGFSSLAPQYLQKMFQKAQHYLQCTAECESACQSCLLSSDTRHKADLLDRHLALNFLQANFIDRLALPSDLKVFGEDSHFCGSSLFEAIRQYANKADTLILKASGDSTLWDIPSSSWRSRSIEWCEGFKEVVLQLTPEGFDRLDEVQREDLYALLTLNKNTRLELASTENTHFLAQTYSATSTHSWASSEDIAANLDKHWGFSKEGILIESTSAEKWSGQLIPKEELRPKVGPGNVEVEISNQLDGRLSTFGTGFWEQVLAAHKPLKDRLDNKSSLVELSYSDRYLMSPCHLLLLAELIDGLRSILTEGWEVSCFKIRSACNQHDRNPRILSHDWSDDQQRKAVMEAMFEYIGQDAQVSLKPKNEISHGRVLRLKWLDGVVTTLRLDQGVGYWYLHRDHNVEFDFSQSSENQAEQLSKVSEVARIYACSSAPTQIFIKNRP
ncbi:MAG: DEAD/DEAH box helicase [Motiliproteus sp.]